MRYNTAAKLQLKRLYHYMPFEKPEHLARIFTEGTIYFSNPKDFNDPWDCRPCYSKEVLNDPKKYDRIVKWFIRCDRKLNTSLPEQERSIRKQELRSNRKLLEWMIDEMTSGMEKAVQSRYRVFCLSIHPDRPLMWSHYGGKHKGVCLEFSTQNKLFCAALKIEYMNQYPLFEVSEDNEGANIQPLLVKSNMWVEEDEFRLVATEAPYTFPEIPITNDGFLQIPPGSLKSVIVGSLMDKTNRKLVETLVGKSGQHVSLKEAKPIADRYELKIHQCT